MFRKFIATALMGGAAVLTFAAPAVAGNDHPAVGKPCDQIGQVVETRGGQLLVCVENDGKKPCWHPKPCRKQCGSPSPTVTPSGTPSATPTGTGTPTPTATATPTPTGTASTGGTPTPSQTTAPAGGNGGGSSGGGLPVTGPGALLLGVIGVLMVVVGTAARVAARRRSTA